MPGRLTHRYAIVARRHAQCSDATPADFELAWASSSDRPHLPDTALAYCADFTAERVLFSLHGRAALARLFEAPFLFPEQLRQAEGVVSVPFERLAESGLPRPSTPPCLVFSPGRTGSTLLVRLLHASGHACASEPDMLQQVVWMGEENRRKLPLGTEERLAAACIAALRRACGGDIVIKLRSQCNERPLVISQAWPGCRVVFMLRRAVPWALSRHRVFRESPAAVAAVLRQAMDALDALSGAGVPPDIVWFETLAADPGAAMRVCVPSAQLDEVSLARTMAQDSQKGTTIARDAVGTLAVQQGFVAAFCAVWAEARARKVWSAQTEALLARMWEG